MMIKIAIKIVVITVVMGLKLISIIFFEKIRTINIMTIMIMSLAASLK